MRRMERDEQNPDLEGLEYSYPLGTLGVLQ